MEIAFDEIALNDLNYWKKLGDVGVKKRILKLLSAINGGFLSNRPSVQKRIQKLLNIIQKTPYTGIGKPEALRYSFTGKWARRINDEHRIVYSIKDNIIQVHSLRGHYES